MAASACLGGPELYVCLLNKEQENAGISSPPHSLCKVSFFEQTFHRFYDDGDVLACKCLRGADLFECHWRSHLFYAFHGGKWICQLGEWKPSPGNRSGNVSAKGKAE